MDLFFQDPDVIPLPPEEVRIRDLSAKPYPDGKRVRILVEIDPFQKRPSLEVMIQNAYGETVSQVRVIETMTRLLEMTMHLRAERLGEDFNLHCLLYYQEMPSPEAGEQEIEYPPVHVVDQRQISFKLPASNGSNPVTGNV